jgi:streptogramin lyase
MANTSNIVNVRYGQAPTVTNGNQNSINPQAKLYALANIVAACVNTSSSASSGCSNLFSAAKSSAGVVATDEANALFNIVHNQATNVSSIWNLTPAAPVFTPTLSAAPTDWTMPVIYTGLVSQPGTNGSNQIVSGPFNIAFDASGNAWIGDRVKGVVEVGPQGASSTFNKSFGMVKGVAVSPVDGSIWVSDYNSNKVDVMDTTGTILSAITTDLNGPILTAFSGNVANRSIAFEANETSTGIVLFDTSAYSLMDYENSSNFTNVQTPGWISVDNTGNAWIPSTSTTYVGLVTTKEKGKSGNFSYTSSQSNGSPNSYSTVSDSSSNIWLASITGTARLEEIASGDTTVSSTWTGGGMNGPYKLAVDGGNHVWLANANANTVSGFNTSGNGSWLATNGFSTSAPGGAGCVIAAPDPSGNLWSANSDGSVTQLLGLATPTASPLYGGIKSTGNNSTPGNLGTMP